MLQHEAGDTFYVVKEGAATVSVDKEGGARGEQQVVHHGIAIHQFVPLYIAWGLLVFFYGVGMLLCQVVAKMGAGDYFGEMALLHDEPRQASGRSDF